MTAPEERPDHAILCVHMGLSMVKAIKYVREKTKSCVGKNNANGSNSYCS